VSSPVHLFHLVAERLLICPPPRFSSRINQIPIRWTAFESLFYRKFSSASDAWAFAVLLHEIFANGGHPYAGHSNSEVVRFVDQGFRLPPEPACPVAVYALMIACWNPDPSERPSFAEMTRSLHTLCTVDAVDAPGLQECGVHEDRLSCVYAPGSGNNPLLLARDQEAMYAPLPLPLPLLSAPLSMLAQVILHTCRQPPNCTMPRSSCMFPPTQLYR